MAKVGYRAVLNIVVPETDVFRQAPIESFSLSGGSASRSVKLASATDTSILALLGQAKTDKSITIFKKPSSQDDVDAVILGLAGGKKAFGFSLDFYVKYTDEAVHFVHFFQEDAVVTGTPTRVGGGKDVLLKVEVSLPKADFKHAPAPRSGGRYIEEDDWNM